MRLLADLNIAPRTVEFLRSLGHDVVRASSPTVSDAQLVELARREQRSILTQDLDFSALVALSGGAGPSVVSLRLSSSRVERVNARLKDVIPGLERELLAGAIVTVEDRRIRSRALPIT